MMFQWMFPGLLYQDMVRTLTWIALHEIELIRLPAPPVMEPRDRRQITRIFKAMDAQGCGYCTAEDISGGERQDMASRLRNLVDAETVRNVYGDEPLDQERFLQLMCEDNFRSHPDAKAATLEDGRKVIEMTNAIIGFRGWVHEVPSKEEAFHRKLVSAIEAEVKRWESLARSRKTELVELQAQGHIFF
jgi:hypothetical protein